MLGWDQEVQQAPQSISLITTINDLEELTEKSGGGGLEGRVQHRQQVLDRAFQRIKVLETQERESWGSTSTYFNLSVQILHGQKWSVEMSFILEENFIAFTFILLLE